MLTTDKDRETLTTDILAPRSEYDEVKEYLFRAKKRITMGICRGL